MKNTKGSKQAPAFLLEVGGATAQIVLRRRYLLRTQSTKALQQVNRLGASHWLRVISDRKVEKSMLWSFAHGLADRLREELGEDVYVEPELSYGRLKEMLTPAEPMKTLPGNSFGGGGNGFHHGLFQPKSDFFSTPGFSDVELPGIPKIPTFEDLLPPQARESLKLFQGGSRLSVPALRETAGWCELSTAKQRMFEVEAAQLIEKLFPENLFEARNSVLSLSAVASHEDCSRALSRYILAQE